MLVKRKDIPIAMYYWSLNYLQYLSDNTNKIIVSQDFGGNTYSKNNKWEHILFSVNDDYTNENNTKHNLNWPYIPDHPYKILIIGGSGYGKTNTLLNLINNQADIDKIYLYAKDPYESKYQFLINKRESTGL